MKINVDCDADVWVLVAANDNSDSGKIICKKGMDVCNVLSLLIEGFVGEVVANGVDRRESVEILRDYLDILDKEREGVDGR